MTPQPRRRRRLHGPWTAEQTATIESLAAAARDAADAPSAEATARVRQAAEVARDAGVGWTTIGETLGIARGNAYQRYRKRPAETATSRCE